LVSHEKEDESCHIFVGLEYAFHPRMKFYNLESNFAAPVWRDTIPKREPAAGCLAILMGGTYFFDMELNKHRRYRSHCSCNCSMDVSWSILSSL
jgi:hypothetical protein